MEEPDATKTGSKEDQLRIAWRYGQQAQSSPQSLDTTTNTSSAKSLQPNYFVMNKLMTKEEVQASSNVKTFSLSDLDTNNNANNKSVNELYVDLAKKISKQIDTLNLNITKTKQYTNILRIGKFFLKVKNFFC
jgi:hypothetical protein